MQKNGEEKIYILDGQSVTVRFRKVKKAKGIRIQISSADRVVVTGGLRTSFRSLEQFFALHREWVKKKLLHFQEFPNPTLKLTPEAYKQKKEAARILVQEKLTYWNQYYHFSWKRVTIRNQSTRWGSCSSAGTLSFHAAIVDLPGSLQDYLIVHELCHVRAMNHGVSFWTLVEKILPNARQLDKGLKKYTHGRVV